MMIFKSKDNMKYRNCFALKIFSLIAAAVFMLAGCSAAEETAEPDAPVTADTEDRPVTESTEDESGTAQTEDTTSTTSTTVTKAETTTTAAETTEETTTTAVTTTTAATTTTTAATTTTTTAAATTTTAAATTATTATTTAATTTTTTAAATTTTTAATTTTTTAATTTTTAATQAPSAPSFDAASIYQTLISFKSKYPEGTSWTNENRSYKSYTAFTQYSYYEGRGCEAFALELSDTVFGAQPVREHHDIYSIRAGDIVRINNDTHSVIVLEVNSDGIVIAEGNYNSSVHWERTLSFTELQSITTYIWTRYP